MPLPPMPWLEVALQVEAQFLRSDSQSPRHVGNRTKQWLAYLKRTYPEANEVFTRLRTLRDVAAIVAAFADHRRLLSVEPPAEAPAARLLRP